MRRDRREGHKRRDTSDVEDPAATAAGERLFGVGPAAQRRQGIGTGFVGIDERVALGVEYRGAQRPGADAPYQRRAEAVGRQRDGDDAAAALGEANGGRDYHRW